MEVVVKAQLTKKELFNYMLRHNYSTFGGIVGALLGIGAIILFIANVTNDEMNFEYKIALLFVFALAFIVQPVMLYIKASNQAKKNEAINKPLQFKFNEEGITISVEDDSVFHKYDAVTKVISTKLSVIIYVSRYNAFVIPKKVLGDDIETIRMLLKDHCTCMKISVK